MEEQAAVRAKLKGKDDVQAEVVKLGINSTFGKFSQNMKKQQNMQAFTRFEDFEAREQFTENLQILRLSLNA